MNDDVMREPDGTIKRKVKRYVTMERPKHPEAYSTREYAAFQPWKVDLKIELDANDPEPIVYTIFCRAQNVHNAQYMAYHVFQKWEHVDPEIEDPYPRVCTGKDNPSEAEMLTEDQWDEFWKEAQRYDHVYIGMRENPSIFRFAKPGWFKRSGFIQGNSNIIVPDKSSITPQMRAQMRKIEAQLKKNNIKL